MRSLAHHTGKFVCEILRSLPSYRRVIDIGCGDGHFALKYFEPSNLFGLDLDEKNRAAFEANLAAHNVSGEFFSHLETLGAGLSSKVDLVSTIGVFELNDWCEIDKICTFAAQNLRRGGLFFALYYPWHSFSPIYFPIFLTSNKRAYEKKNRIKVFEHSLKDVRERVELSGLEVTSSGCLNPYPALCWRHNLPSIGFSKETTTDRSC